MDIRYKLEIRHYQSFNIKYKIIFKKYLFVFT